MLNFDPTIWERQEVVPKKTLQFFITSKCNKRCSGCFYQEYLGNDYIPIEEYKEKIHDLHTNFERIILMGGEPTFHPKLREMIEINNDYGLQTTVYTNGYDLSKLKNVKNTSIRVGVLGFDEGEKQLKDIPIIDDPIKIVLMLRTNNINQIEKVSKYAENFNCESFYLSSIRDIYTTKSYWKDTDETIPNEEYVNIVNNFIKIYDGNLKKIEFACRGLIPCDDTLNICRFFNIHLDGTTTICPFDISLNIKNEYSEFLTNRKCNKNKSCILQKIVLNKKV